MSDINILLRNCYWCGVKLTKKGTKLATSATKDHLIPVSRGGGNGPNKVPCCRRCNIKKGSRTAEEFRQ